MCVKASLKKKDASRKLILIFKHLQIYKIMSLDFTITKTCSVCGEEKSKFKEFNLTKNTRGEVTPKASWCRDCNSKKEYDRRAGNNNWKEYQAKYRLENKEKIRAHYEENKDQILEKCKEYRDSHQEQIREYKHNYYQKEENKQRVNEKVKLRKKTDPQFKLMGNIRQGIHRCLRGKKLNSTEELIDCDQKFLKDWIEYQWKSDENMSWSNYGTYWHIDHVIPLSFFDLDNINEQTMACNWSNLRPLEARENLSKNDAIRKEDVLNHMKVISSFHQEPTNKTWYDILKSHTELLNKENHNLFEDNISIILRHFQTAGTS